MPRFHYRGGELDLTQHTHIMGILNITPDSFSDGGRYDTVEAAVEPGPGHPSGRGGCAGHWRPVHPARAYPGDG